MLIAEVKTILEISNKKMLLNVSVILPVSTLMIPNDSFFSLLNITTGQFQSMDIVPKQINILLTLLFVNIQTFIQFFHFLATILQSSSVFGLRTIPIAFLQNSANPEIYEDPSIECRTIHDVIWFDVTMH